MSATIYWKPTSPAQGTVPVGSASMFMEAMQRVFGNAPWTLGPENIPVLTGMAAVEVFGSKRDNPYQHLIDKIQNGGEGRYIQVWGEY